MKPYRIGVISDMHTGSHVGLRSDPQNEIQEALLAYWHECIPLIEGCDLLIVNGDCNDGQDPRGRNLQSDDVPWQIEEAEALILSIRPRAVRMTVGSAYHVGDTVQHERFLAGYLARRGLDASLKNVQRLTVGWWEGVFRHVAPRSIIPHGRFTGPARSRMWGAIKAAQRSVLTGEPAKMPDMYVFSHTHYYAESIDGSGRVVVTPGWKAAGVKDAFGAKHFDDEIDVGLMLITIHDPGDKEAGYSVHVRHRPAEIVDESERIV